MNAHDSCVYRLFKLTFDEEKLDKYAYNTLIGLKKFLLSELEMVERAMKPFEVD